MAGCGSDQVPDKSGFCGGTGAMIDAGVNAALIGPRPYNQPPARNGLWRIAAADGRYRASPAGSGSDPLYRRSHS